MARNVWHIRRWKELYEPDADKRRGRRSPLHYVKDHVYGDNVNICQQEVEQVRRSVVKKGGRDLWCLWTWIRAAAAKRTNFRGWFLNHRLQPATYAEIAEMIGVDLVTGAEIQKAFKQLSAPDIGLIDQTRLENVRDEYIFKSGKNESVVVWCYITHQGQILEVHEGVTRERAIQRAKKQKDDGTVMNFIDTPRPDAQTIAAPPTQPTPGDAGETDDDADPPSPTVIPDTPLAEATSAANPLVSQTPPPAPQSPPAPSTPPPGDEACEDRGDDEKKPSIELCRNVKTFTQAVILRLQYSSKMRTSIRGRYSEEKVIGDRWKRAMEVLNGLELSDEEICEFARRRLSHARRLGQNNTWSETAAGKGIDAWNKACKDAKVGPNDPQASQCINESSRARVWMSAIQKEWEKVEDIGTVEIPP